MREGERDSKGPPFDTPDGYSGQAGPLDPGGPWKCRGDNVVVKGSAIRVMRVQAGAAPFKFLLPQNVVDPREKLHIEPVMAKTAAKKTAVRKESDLLANLRKLAAKIPAAEMAKIPKDASITYKKYLYGQSK